MPNRGAAPNARDEGHYTPNHPECKQSCPPGNITVFPQTMLVDYVRVYKRAGM